MTWPFYYRRPDGTAVLDLLPGRFVEALREVPGLCDTESAAPEVRERVFPAPRQGDDALRAEWRRNVEPELFALLVSAREVVERDLAALATVAGAGRRFRLEIPPAHVPAWVSALNVARLHLAVRHAVSADDMQRDEPAEDPEREAALSRIDLFAEIQYLLIRGAE